MKKILTLLGLSAFIVNLTWCQNFEWAKQFEGTDGAAQSQGKAITTDNDGNIYSTGVFFGDIDFDPGSSSTILTTGTGGVEIYVTKSDSEGNLLWVKQFQGNSFNSSEDIAVDIDGNVYITGYFRQTVDFNPGSGTFNLTSEGNTDIFITKLNNDGDFIWAKQFGGSSFNGANSIAVDASGNVFTTGYFKGLVDFNPGAGTFNLTAAGSSDDAFISKLNASGDLVWVKQFSGAENVRGNGITVDASGSVYTIGSFQGTTDFDPGTGSFDLTSAGFSDVYISKIDETGNFVWAKQFSGIGSNDAYAIAVANSGNIYTVGRFEETIDVDPGINEFNLISPDNNNTFVTKLNSTGDFVWGKQLEGTDIIGRDLVIDEAENCYLTGEFQGVASIEPSGININLTSEGGLDFFIAKLNESGDFLWAESYGSPSNETSQSLAVDNQENVVFTGEFAETVNFNPSGGSFDLTSGGSFDSFILKISQCGTNTIDITTSVSDLTITANNTNATYQWVDCDDNNAPIPGETNQSFTATANGNYAVEITENGCTETSDCIAITTVGLDNNKLNTVVMYPNPAKTSVTIAEIAQPSSIIITDLNGRVMFTSATDATSLEIALDNFASGVYLVNVVNEQQKITQKLIVK